MKKSVDPENYPPLVRLELDAQRYDRNRDRRNATILGIAAVACAAGAFFAAEQNSESTIASDVLGVGCVAAAVGAINTGYKAHTSSIDIDTTKAALDRALARPEVQAGLPETVAVVEVMRRDVLRPDAGPSEQ